MRVGKWVPLYRKIVPIPQRLAIAFGLTEGSQLHLAPLQDTESRLRHDYEIIASPIPIQSWNSTCRLSVRIKDFPKSLAIATRFLRQHKINILLTESCSTYKDRAHWDAVCDVAETTGFSTLRSARPPLYERAMQNFLQRLTDELDQFIEQPENSEAFLRGPEKHAQFTPLTGLNDSAFYADFSRSVTLSYRSGGIQIPDNLATHIVNICNLDALPGYSMITGNTEQRYLRIHFLRNHRSMFQAVIENELRGMAGGGIGVLNQFLEALPKEINIIRMSNYITEKDNDTEKGQIELIGYWDLHDANMTEQVVIQEHMKRELSNVLRSVDIEDTEGVRHGPLLRLVDLSSPDLLYPRVFISHSTHHEPEKVQLLMNRLWENHFQPILGTDAGQEEDFPRENLESDDPTIAPTMVQSMFQKIKTCVALISLHVKRSDFHVEPTDESNQGRYIAPPYNCRRGIRLVEANKDVPH